MGLVRWHAAVDCIPTISDKPMTLSAILEKTPEISTTDYVAIGVATCFRRNESDLEVVKVLEPIPSAYLESLVQGVPTSYERVIATTVGELLGDINIAQFAKDEDVHFCENFSDRVVAAARTYKARPTAQAIVAVGTTRADFNYSTEKKRVLNFENVVKAEDNIRQHEYTHKTL